LPTSSEANEKTDTIRITLCKAFSKKAAWSDKDELLDVIYWGRQLISLFIGVICGVVPIKGLVALLLYVAISTLVGHYYLTWFQCQDDEIFGGFWEVSKEGFGAAFATFMITWIAIYTTFHFN